MGKRKAAVIILAALSGTLALADYDHTSIQPYFSEYYYGSNSQGSSPVISLDMDPQHSLDSSFRIAVRENRIEDAKRFLQDGADVNGASSSGETALMYASRACLLGALNYLLSVPKLNPNLADKEGRTALIYAAEGGCDIGTQMLAQRPETDLLARDQFKMTARMYAERGRLDEVGGPYSSIVRTLRIAERKHASQRKVVKVADPAQ